MKKSEVINKLAKFYFKYCGMGDELATNNAESTVAFLEEEGLMVPPERPNDYGAVNSLGVVTMINEWEKEDES